ncbi:hypothetical protein D3C76_1875390 [compost metagenome]
MYRVPDDANPKAASDTDEECQHKSGKNSKGDLQQYFERIRSTQGVSGMQHAEDDG